MKRGFFKTICVMLMVFAVIFTSCMDILDTSIVDAATPVITVQPGGGTLLTTGSTNHTMTVTASVSDDGNLEYQWYSYEKPFEYESHTGKEIPGQTNDSYTPALGHTEGIHNFYVIVTNNNTEVNGKKKVSVQSNPVSISINTPGNALFPNISLHPANIGQVIFGRNMVIPELLAAASVEEGELSFQWYETTSLSNDQGTPIDGATTPSFRPNPSKPGDYYYFLLISNYDRFAEGRRITSVRTNPAFVKVITNPNAVAPVINVHPRGAIYFNADTVEAITVAAEPPEDLGTLSYQWYSNTRASNTGGSIIGGATSASYTPSINTGSIATHYFYAVVTNFAEHATNNKTAAAASRVAELVVTTPSTAEPNALITVNMNDKRQFVRGFGGMDVAWGNFPSYTFEDYENMYNPDRLGYNILRIMILPHSTDIKDTMYKLTTNQISGSETRHNLYEYVRLVNRYNGYVFASPWTPPAVWKNNNSTVGSPANVAFLRLNNYTSFAWYLRTFAQLMVDNAAPIYAVSIANEPNYAATYDGCIWSGDQMRDFFRLVGRFTRSGPQGSAGIMYPSDVPGYGGGKTLPYVLTMSGESANSPAIHNSAMNDTTGTNNAKQYIDILGRHPYGSRSENLAGQPGSGGAVNITYNADPREVWQTEFNLNSNNATMYPQDHTWSFVWQFLNSIDITIRNNHENAYIWWSNKRWYSFLGDGQYGTRNGEILPRGWAQAHYAKFANETYQVGVTYAGTLGNAGSGLSSVNINPGEYTNLTAENPATAAKVTAFVKLRDGEPFKVNWRNRNVSMEEITEISFVMYTPTLITGAGGRDLGTVMLKLPDGFIIRGATAMRSTQADVGDRTNPKEPVWERVRITADRNAAYVDLPPSQILSVKFTR